MKVLRKSMTMCGTLEYYGLVLCFVLISIRLSLMQRHYFFERSMELVTMDVIHRTGCLQDIGPVRSCIQATAICVQMEECIAVSCEHNATLALMTCNTTHPRETILPDRQLIFSLLYKAQCWNGGVQEKSTCKCSDGWVGRYCERRARDCTELFEHGYDKVNTFMVINVYEFPLMCQFHGGKPRSVLIRHNGQFNFNISWKEFETGWNRGTKNVFVGLRNMYNIINVAGSAAVARLTFHVADEKVIWEYHNFTLNDQWHSYKYNYTHSTKTERKPSERMTALGDCLAVSKGMPFSTWDRDNDWDVNVNCALKHGTGWWFGNCSSGAMCSLFGLSPFRVTPAQEEQAAIFPGLNLSAFDQSGKWLIHLNLLEKL